MNRILVILLIITSLQAMSQTETKCKLSVMGMAVKFLKNDLKYQSKNNKYDTVPSVKVLGEALDKDGLSFYVFEKIAKHWRSTFTPAPQNFQGDIRWFPMAMGSRIGYFFGFRKISENQVTAPTSETLNTKINWVNAKLKDRKKETIHVKFYESGDEPTEGFQFLKRFKNEYALPIAKDGHYTIHDLSYHSGAILIPKVVLDGIKKRIEILERFSERVEADVTLNQLEKKLLLEFVKRTVSEFVKLIDYGTGNVSYILALEKTGQVYSHRPFEAYDMKNHVLHYLVDQTQSLISKIPEKVEELFLQEIGYVYGRVENVSEYIPVDVPISDREVLVNKSKEKITNFIKEFMKAEQKSIQQSQQYIKIEDFVNFIRNRIKSLDDIVTGT